MQDRRLVLVVQGDEVTTYYQMWLETPCDDHGQHVLTNRLCEEPGITAESEERELLEWWAMADQTEAPVVR